jgi:hypothetical protein
MTKSEVYADFFETPFVKSYLERHGLENPTESVIVRRVPFLFNILEALGIINQGRSEIKVLSFIPSNEIIKLNTKEKIDEVESRVSRIIEFSKEIYSETKPSIEVLQEKYFSADEVSMLKETFGSTFLTESYYLTIEEI